jgi:hypothetical protein
MHAILLASTEGEAISFARAAGLNRREVTIPMSTAALMGWHPAPEDVILQFHSFKDHPQHDAIEGELLVKLAHFGKGPKPKWARAGQ